jgi:hypothetical protein
MAARPCKMDQEVGTGMVFEASSEGEGEREEGRARIRDGEGGLVRIERLPRRHTGDELEGVNWRVVPPGSSEFLNYAGTGRDRGGRRRSVSMCGVAVIVERAGRSGYTATSTCQW